MGTNLEHCLRGQNSNETNKNRIKYDNLTKINKIVEIYVIIHRISET